MYVPCGDSQHSPRCVGTLPIKQGQPIVSPSRKLRLVSRHVFLFDNRLLDTLSFSELSHKKVFDARGSSMARDPNPSPKGRSVAWTLPPSTFTLAIPFFGLNPQRFSTSDRDLFWGGFPSCGHLHPSFQGRSATWGLLYRSDLQPSLRGGLSHVHPLPTLVIPFLRQDLWRFNTSGKPLP